MSAYERQGLRNNLVFAPALGIRSSGTFAAINTELRRQLQRAMAMVETDRDTVRELVERLIAEKVLSGDDVMRTLDIKPLATPKRQARIRKVVSLQVSNRQEGVP